MKSQRQSRDIQVSQGSLNFSKREDNSPTQAFIAQVLIAYPDRMTCDVLTADGAQLCNIPVVIRGGLLNEEPYGEFDIPLVDDYVIIMDISRGDRRKAIIGTIYPYLTNEFNADAVNSGSKQFTKKLLEEGTELHYKRIFKSGTSVEVEEDGTIVIETPSGAYVLFDEDTQEIKVEDPHGNIVILDVDGIDVTDTSGNTVEMTSSGMVLTDANGNDITMAAAGVSINGNLDVAP